MMISLMLAAAAAFAVAAIRWTIQFNSQIVAEGQTYLQAVTATGNNKVASGPSIPAATGGTLTVRTDDTTGTLTMNAGHGITTGAKFSLFFSGGSQRDITAGTVSGNSVPFSLGTGDALPAAASAITAMVPVSEVFALTGDNCTGIFGSWQPQPGDGNAYIEFESSGPAVLLDYEVNALNNSGSWDGTGTNPLAGVTVATVRFSHGQTSARTMYAYALYN